MGMENARVLPLPVFPRPSTSRPERVSGRVSIWIGNGEVIPPSSRAFTSGARTPRAAKVVAGVEMSDKCVQSLSGTCSCPDADTGINRSNNQAQWWRRCRSAGFFAVRRAGALSTQQENLRSTTLDARFQAPSDRNSTFPERSTYNPTHSETPFAKCWRFQIGTSCLMRSTSSAHAANASARCGAATAATSARSPISR